MAAMIVGMMISAFAKASQVLADAAYLEKALKAIQFVQRELYCTDPSAAAINGRLLRSCYVDSSTTDLVHRFGFFYLQTRNTFCLSHCLACCCVDPS